MDSDTWTSPPCLNRRHPLCPPPSGLNTVLQCPSGSSCWWLSRQQLASTFGGATGLAVDVGTVGVCAYTPRPMLLPNASAVPPPM